MSQRSTVGLDLRPMAPESRIAAVLEEFDRMNPGDAILVDSPQPALEVLHALQRRRPGLFDWAPVDHAPCWRVELSRHAALGGGPRISDTLAWEHARLDDLQRSVLAALRAGSLREARRHFTVFERRLHRHIQFEEEILFPLFESKEAGPERPARVMRAEHREIRMLLERAGRALYGPLPEAERLCQSLHARLERHDLDEEAAFYDRFDQLLEPAERATLVERIQEFA